MYSLCRDPAMWPGQHRTAACAGGADHADQNNNLGFQLDCRRRPRVCMGERVVEVDDAILEGGCGDLGPDVDRLLSLRRGGSRTCSPSSRRRRASPYCTRLGNERAGTRREVSFREILRRRPVDDQIRRITRRTEGALSSITRRMPRVPRYICQMTAWGVLSSELSVCTDTRSLDLSSQIAQECRQCPLFVRMLRACCTSLFSWSSFTSF